MSKLNIYRSILMICFAAIMYVWPSMAPVMAGWWMMALIGIWAEKIAPSHGKSSVQQIVLGRFTGPLSAWICLWNGFYVWKDLDHNYHRKNRG